MSSRLRSSSLRCSLLCLAVWLTFATSGFASTFKVIYTFGSSGTSDAAWPQGTLIRDAAGNLYGTTVAGGAYGNGAVYEVSPGSDGNWTEKILYSFTGKADGAVPVAGLMLDSDGTLYGTTQRGGTFSKTCSPGCGVVFKLSPGQAGWTETVLHSFAAGRDGAWPNDGVILDSAENLYGTTAGGGRTDICAQGCGMVFELLRAKGWEEKVLHAFTSYPTDGDDPSGGLTFDAKGNLLGTTPVGGIGPCCVGYNGGTVFELTPQADGTWSEALLHTFCSDYACRDGNIPSAGVVVHNGEVYGTTLAGGPGEGVGEVYRVPEMAGGSSISAFALAGAEGEFPVTPVLFVGEQMFGTAQQGGMVNGACPTAGNGVVFELERQGSALNETVLYSFTGGDDGCAPAAGLVADRAGNLYGTAENGGEFGSGVIFEVTP